MLATRTGCAAADSLWHAGHAPAPDVIKVDVVGTEYEILPGFGGLLAGCLVIEVQAHLYPIMHDEKLLHDIVTLMADHGMMPRRIEDTGQFDGVLVVVNAYFTPARHMVRSMAADRRAAFELVREVFELPAYPP